MMHTDRSGNICHEYRVSNDEAFCAMKRVRLTSPTAHGSNTIASGSLLVIEQGKYQLIVVFVMNHNLSK